MIGRVPISGVWGESENLDIDLALLSKLDRSFDTKLGYMPPLPRVKYFNICMRLLTFLNCRRYGAKHTPCRTSTACNYHRGGLVLTHCLKRGICNFNDLGSAAGGVVFFIISSTVTALLSGDIFSSEICIIVANYKISYWMKGSPWVVL